MKFDTTFVTFTGNDEGNLEMQEVWYLELEAAALPRTGDVVLIDGINYRVRYLAWNYPDDEVRVEVCEIIGDLT